MRARRWTVLACVLSVFWFVLIGTLKQKPVYRATGSLEIELPQSSVSSLEDLFQVQGSTPDSYLGTQVKLLSSSLLTSRVLAALSPARAELGGNSPAAPSSHLDWQHLNVELVKGTRLIQINFEDEDPERAAKVVNLLMASYLSSIQQHRSATAQNASSWLVDQLNDTRQKLDLANAKFQQYEKEHQLAFASSEESQPTKTLRDELEHAEAERMGKESLYKQMQSSDPAVLQSALTTKLLETKSQLQEEYSQVAANYGPDFPRVKEVAGKLAELRKSLASEQQRIFDQARIEYETALQQELLLRRAVEKQEQLVGGTAQQILQDNILKRDVDLNRQLYDSLLQRLEEAGITSKLDSTNARIIDSARPPASPVRPNRLLKNSESL
jgi:polysaccharide biosynthesis transport protein